MATPVRPGPQPWRKRLQELNVEALGEGLRALVTYAQGHGESLVMGARELAEAVLVAHQASVARSALACGKSVTPRDLAALGGVTPSRIRQLVAAGTLRREGGLITAESALGWLKVPSAKSPIKAHRHEITPSWWKLGPHTEKTRVMLQLIAMFREKMPPEASIYPSNTDILFTIPRKAGVDVATAERIRTEFIDWLEARAPGQ